MGDSDVLAFGRFRVLVEQCQLLADGEPVALGSRAFEVLLALAHRHGQLVTKDQLIAEVWPGIAIEDNTLAVHISALRRALGEGIDGARYVQTVPGRGYRFVIPVVREGREPPSEIVGGPLVTPLDTRTSAAGATSVFAPPLHSVAVLAFVNMSGDPAEEYFSDGISEELIYALSRIEGLQVAARTSSFSFKSKDVSITDVARQLNVGAVLEGSVRRANDRVRITAQLINAKTGYHLWSESYDRKLTDIFALQMGIAEAVTGALEVVLLRNAAKKFALGGTKVAQAFDAYLSGTKLFFSGKREEGAGGALAALDLAVTLDPNYALAHALRARVLRLLAGEWTTDPALIRARFAQAHLAAERAVALAPELGEAHAALAQVLQDGFFDFAGADAANERALALAPGSADVQRAYAGFAASLGRTKSAIAAAQRALVLDPLNFRSKRELGEVFYFARRYQDALIAYQGALSLGANPDDPEIILLVGLTHLALGEPELALKVCSNAAENWLIQVCLAVAYHKLGHQAEARAELRKIQLTAGETYSYQYALIHAQWGEPTEALGWLAAAYRNRDSGLAGLQVDPLLDPIRNTLEFKEIERKLFLPK
jgi:TolB-like protein/Tfp pilus assembly protein PilF